MEHDGSDSRAILPIRGGVGNREGASPFPPRDTARRRR